MGYNEREDTVAHFANRRFELQVYMRVCKDLEGVGPRPSDLLYTRHCTTHFTPHTPHPMPYALRPMP